MRKVLVVGATGFIGHNLTIEWNRLSDDFIVATGLPSDDFAWMGRLGSVIPACLNVNKPENYDQVLRGVDLVVYLAGSLVPGRSNKSISKELDGITSFATFLESCVNAGVDEVVYMSSGGAIYGKGKPPFDEGRATNPITTYGLEKLTCEKLLGLFHDQKGLGYRIIRLSNPYGPYQNPFSGQGVIAAFINKALRGEDLELWGDGSTSRDFIYIKDAVRAVFDIAHADALRNEVVNLGSGFGTSILEAAKLVVNTVGSGSKVILLPSRSVDVPENWLDISRYRNACAVMQATTLKEGIRLTAEWQRKHLLDR